MKSESVSYTNEYGALVASATASWPTNDASTVTVTVTIDYADPSMLGWKVVGYRPDGDNSMYIDASSGTHTASFTAKNGRTYVFQVNESGNVTNSGDGVFTVDTSSSSGDDDDYEDDDDDGGSSGGSSGGGSSGSGRYTFNYTQGAGTELYVERTWNEATGEDYEGSISSGTSIVWKDVFRVYVRALDGYENPQVSFSNFDIASTSSDNDWDIIYKGDMQTEGNITATSSATPKQYTLTLNEGTGSSLTVTRVQSNMSGVGSGILTNGSTIYHGDVLQITCNANTGYDILSIQAGSGAISNGGTYTVSGYTTITSSAEVKSYDLILRPSTGTTITVNRTSSPLKGASTSKTWTSSTNATYSGEIYHNDKLTITFSASAGYQASQQLVNQSPFVSGSSHTVTGDVEASTAAELSGIVHIFNGSDFNNYTIHIFNGSTWDQYIPWIFDGSQWCICS